MDQLAPDVFHYIRIDLCLTYSFRCHHFAEMCIRMFKLCENLAILHYK